MRTTLAAGLVLLALAWAAPASAATIHVNCAHANLQNKINGAPAGSTLEIAGTCVGHFTVSKSLHLVGDPTATLDGNDGGITLTLGVGTVELRHLVVTGGRIAGGVQAFGAGINASNTQLTLRHVVLKGNVAHATASPADVAIAEGGGISSFGGSLTVIDSVVKGNSAKAEAGTVFAFGGGIYRVGLLTIKGSKIASNSTIGTSQGTSGSIQGGGLFIDEGNLLAKASSFTGNRAKITGPAGPMTAEGGGIYFSDAFAITLQRTRLADNVASVESQGSDANAHGGGAGGAVNSANFANTTWSGNRAHAASNSDAEALGGAASLQTGGTVKFVLSRVMANQADAHGTANVDSASGGVDLANGRLVFQSSTVNGNTATSPTGASTSASGGGLAVDNELVVSNSTVSRNVASATGGQSLGGGIILAGTGSGSITNSTIASNQAIGSTARGGGIDTFRNLTLTSSTVAGNSAKLGGGLYKEVGTTTLQATILAANTASSSGPNCRGGNFDSAGRNLVADTTGCIFSALAGDILDKPAKLGTLGAHGGPTQTIPILATSPALNAVPIAACQVNRDQRGVKRPQGARCDIGAFERKT